MSALEVVQWLNWADQDYLAARSLLARAFLLQGAILANTAIEKYIKAVLTHRAFHFLRDGEVMMSFPSMSHSNQVVGRRR
ncbi:MAG TPA: hypothetical protein VGG72_20980 [Bryobacteraceae bacterium]|jgi:hypothetical protein